MFFTILLDMELSQIQVNSLKDRVCETCKGQIISECPHEIIVYPKIATKIFLGFLSWKFTTSRLTQKESLYSVCKKIDSVL